MRIGLTSTLPRAAAAALLLLLASPYAAEAIGVATPEEMNMDSEPLAKIADDLRDQVAYGQLAGAAFQVYRGGKLIYGDTVGYQDRELFRAFQDNTIVRLMSQTKPLVAAGVMMLIERGQLSLDDPLWKFHGGFRNMRVTDWNGGTVASNRDITIRDLLCHTAGLGYSGGFNDPTGDSVLSSLRTPFESLQQFMDDLARKPLYWQPGSGWRYSWSYDVLGYVIQKVTHQTPDTFLRVNLFAPLKMYDTDFYVPAGKIDRFAVAYTRTRAGLIPLLRPRMDPLQAFNPPTFLSCGSGIVSTLSDYARFGMMLLNGGELEGVRVLRAETVDMMWRNQLAPELLPMDLNGWKSDDYTGWGFGFTVSAPYELGNIKNIDWSTKTGAKRTGTIGWGGGMMTNWIASADNDLLVVFATQRLATPIPNTFQEVVVSGVMKAIKGPSPRQLPGPGYEAIDVGADGGFGQGQGHANAAPARKPRQQGPVAGLPFVNPLNPFAFGMLYSDPMTQKDIGTDYQTAALLAIHEEQQLGQPKPAEAAEEEKAAAEPAADAANKRNLRS